MKCRRKRDPETLRIAARPRRETLRSLKRIATRVGLESSTSAKAKLHTWLPANRKPNGVAADTKDGTDHARKTKRTRA